MLELHRLGCCVLFWTFALTSCSSSNSDSGAADANGERGGAPGNSGIGGTSPSGGRNGSAASGGSEVSDGGGSSSGGEGAVDGLSGIGGAGGWAGTVGGATGGGGSSGATAGCGRSTWPPTNDQSGSDPYTLTINGTTREFYVSVPTTYDASRPTRVIFAWHWLTASARSVINGGFAGGPYYGLKSRIPDAIYVAAEGLGNNGQTGWANTGGRDVAFLRAMLDWLDESYCVDKTRIFSVGFSYGGIMSDTAACQLGSTFRAIGTFAGSMFGGGNGCVNQRVAAHMTHGTADTTLDISGDIAARDYLIRTNHCTTTAVPIDPSPCVAYQGCDPGYPVVWCEHSGGHTVPSFAPPAVAAFFQQF